jgi:prevent-host-death family protein
VWVRVVNVLEAKTSLSALLAAVEAGEEVVISRAGTPVARLVAIDASLPRPIGIDDGRIRIADDFDDFIPDEFRF